mmetsp:Transcript_29386/g.44399  ORF Transcript_29386/g.44399 Transcript_29386/m.44399 type:complete len:185 (+) Transcript_29386:967-1521(+)
MIQYEKLICYVSAFHLNVNDWFQEHENLEIFNQNLQTHLGACWVLKIRDSMKSPSQVQKESVADQTQPLTSSFFNPFSQAKKADEKEEVLPGSCEHYFLLFTLFLMTTYQATNIAEAYMTFQHLKTDSVVSQRMMPVFVNDALSFACGKGYQIKDMALFKEATQAFFEGALIQYEKILKKIESD